MKQKIQISFCLLILSLTANLNTETPKINRTKMLKGSIVSNQLSTIPNFKVYYQGTQTVSNDDGFFTIPIEDINKKEKYSLLVCKDFKPTFDGVNTVKNLTINTKKQYKFFVLTKATTNLLQEKIEVFEKDIKPLNLRKKLVNRQIARQSKKMKTKKTKRILRALKKRRLKIDSKIKVVEDKILGLKDKFQELKNSTPENPARDFWFINEKQLAKGRVPDDCVVVCLNPKTVDRLENWNFALASNFTAFPKIILKNNLETRNVKKKQSITRSSLKSELYSFEQKTFHELKKESYKKIEGKPNVKLSLVQ